MGRKHTGIVSAILVTDHGFYSVLPYYIADAGSSYKWFEGILTSNKSNATISDFAMADQGEVNVKKDSLLMTHDENHPGKWHEYRR